MSHFYFAFYLTSLLSGLVLLTHFLPRFRQSPAYVETLAIYIILTVFVVAGTATVYVIANLADASLAVRIFVSTTASILGALVYLLPRYHHMRWQKTFVGRPHHTFLALAMCGPATSIALGVVPSSVYLYCMLFPIGALFIALVYGLIIQLKRKSSLEGSRLTLIVNGILPLVSVCLAMLEVLLFRSRTIEHGLVFSLPLIYLASNASVWLLRAQLLPAPVSNAADISYPESLSGKEREIVSELFQGYSNKQIADHLSISTSTVKNHLYNIYKKTGVTSRTALISLLRQA